LPGQFSNLQIDLLKLDHIFEVRMHFLSSSEVSFSFWHIPEDGARIHFLMIR
jgi:hypothetical protein